VTWPAAALVLVLANVIGLVVATPQLISRRLTGKSQMAFGPMLIAATYLVFLFGRPILDFLGENLFLFW
jgi:prepilin signal peptidase PulO-like enzyme (type II secretory pathway)